MTGFGPRNRELVYLGNETYRVDEYPNDIKIESSSKDGSVYLVVLRDGIDSSKYDRHLKKTVD